MPLGATELGCQEGLHQVPGYCRSYGTATHADDVHMIVLDPLPGGEVVVNQAGADAGILLAQTAAPTPLPQMAIPRSTFPAATAWARGMTKSG